MDIKLSVFDVLLLFGIVQGFIISVIIWWKRDKGPDKLLLSFLLTIFNLLCIKIIFLTSGLWQTRVLRYFPLPFDLAIQPLLFLYITSLTSTDFRLTKKQFLHFIPFFISFAYSLFVYLSVLPLADLAQKDNLANELLFNQIKEGEDLLSVCSAVIYWYLGLKLILRYRRWLYNNTSNTLFPTYEWLRNLIILLGVFFLMIGINIVLDYGIGYGATHFFHWQILFIYLAVLIYYLGFRGHQIPSLKVSDFKTGDENQFPLNAINDEQCQIEELIIGQELAITDAIPPEAVKHKGVGEVILKLLSEERLYLDPEFSLQKLADKLNMSPVAVSRIINSELKKNFRNLVNEYRIEEVKTRLKESRSSQFSLLGIAYECGFNSEASFYRIFKNIVGLSPKEYLLRQQNH